MKKGRLARLLTLAAIAAGLLVVAARSGKLTIRPTALRLKPIAAAQAAPEETVYRLLDAARTGDGNAYIGCYAGGLESALRKSREEMTPARFAEYLTDIARAIKGVVIPPPTAVTEGEVSLRVEWVYADRNEAQQMWLQKFPEGWKITRLEETQRAKTLIPYGTPVE